MKKSPNAEPFVPEHGTLAVLRNAVQQCRGCDLYRDATQAVFGEAQAQSSKDRPSLMMVGEQPGDREDIEGRPFVGPAGKLLDKCLEEAGIPRSEVYITNAVKHFKWEPRGKRRLHKKPTPTEVRACRPWLDAEIEALDPKLIVCLGSTASQALLGSDFRVTRERGKPIERHGLPTVIATVHPSSILRARTDEDRHKEKANFIADLKKVPEYLEK
ncbi:MAG: UdgX family uracil-DNA binding protein [Terracidiphilus sp.]